MSDLTPDIAELRDHIAATIHRRICEHSREDCIENLGDCERATDSAMPLVSTALDEGNALARLLADALNDAIRTLRELAEKAAGEPIPFDDFDLYAEVVDGALNAAAERDALVAAIERQKEGREYLRAERDALRNWSHDLQVELKGAEAQRQMLLAERDALAAAVERVRALHVEQYAGCCNACDSLWPCDTIRALNESEADHD